MNQKKVVEKIKTIATYCRISTTDQKEGFSLENQLEANLQFIKMKFGPNVTVMQYTDIESGAKTTRKDLVRLLDDCERGKIDGIVLWRIDRFMRNASAGLSILSELTETKHIEVYSVTEGQIDFTDPNNKLVSTLHLGIAEMERARIQQRVGPGMEKGARLGHYQGTRYVFYGATYNKPFKRLEWLSNETKMLKILFERVSKGASTRSAAKYLFLQGYRTRRGKAFLTKFLGDCIKREIYCDGYLRWNGIISETPVLKPIIDRTTWEKANRTVAAYRSPSFANRKFSRRDDSPFVLQTILKCRICAGNMVGSYSKGVRYYVCSTTRSKTSAVCKGQYLKAAPLEEQALQILKQVVENKTVLALAKEEAKRMMADRNPELLNAIRVAEMQLRELGQNERELFKLFYGKGINQEQFQRENERLLAQQAMYKANLTALETKRKALQAQSLNSERIFTVLEQFDRIYTWLDSKAKKSLFSWVFSYAHAICLGNRKPKVLDKFELNQPFKKLFNPEKWIETKNKLISQCKNFDITLSPMAGHMTAIGELLLNAEDAERFRNIMEVLALGALQLFGNS